MIEMSLTLAESDNKAKMRSVFKGDTGQIGFSVVKVLVNRFLESFAFSTKLNDSQVEILTVDTLENFAYESLEDIILFFKMARSGKFGSAKKGIDSNLIFGEWFPQFMEQKSILREQNQPKPELRQSATDEDIFSYKKKLLQKKHKEKVQKHVDYITKNMDRQMLEDFIIDWQKDSEKAKWVYLLKEKRKQL
ncbi:MAG: hypothetical protein CMC76_12165 [Flavobacteriaceae bacterium]|nr:hypothetical protein [Flavobacteriaceae bacterium]|tara:strand:+ start:645 stop:1220 length:576 start_codon:yes stop_codon:yes gene_type:complete